MSAMPSVVGIDHLVSAFATSRARSIYGKVLGFLGFEFKHAYPDMAGWSNGKTLFSIAAADGRARSTSTARATSAFTTTRSSFRAARMWTRSALPGRARHECGRSARRVSRAFVHAVYFTDPDGMKLEGMVFKPPPKKRRARKQAKHA